MSDHTEHIEHMNHIARSVLTRMHQDYLAHDAHVEHMTHFGIPLPPPADPPPLANYPEWVEVVTDLETSIGTYATNMNDGPVGPVPELNLPPYAEGGDLIEDFMILMLHPTIVWLASPFSLYYIMNIT